MNKPIDKIKEEIRQELFRDIEKYRKEGKSEILQAMWYVLADQPDFYKAIANALDDIYIRQQLEIKRVKSFFDIANQIVL